jgi:D-alanine-D-alanine ligase
VGKRVQDPAAFGKVAVVMGGVAAEREISLISGQAVLAALLRRGIDAIGIDVDDHPLAALEKGRYDRVFNVMHGRGGEDGVLQGALEALKLPYTGSGVLASALSMDKLRTKLCWLGAGLPTPGWQILGAAEDIDRCIERLGFPVIVKPSQEGSSIGMGKAENRNELEEAWGTASQYGCETFAERWVEGSEYTVGLLEDAPLPLIRLETPRQFYDFDAKYRAETTRYHCPCGLSAEREQALQSLALEASRIIGVSGWGRVDLLLDNESRPWLIEVNTVPGMTDHSLVPMAARVAGIEFDQLVWRILETSFRLPSEHGE